MFKGLTKTNGFRLCLLSNKWLLLFAILTSIVIVSCSPRSIRNNNGQTKYIIDDNQKSQFADNKTESVIQDKNQTIDNKNSTITKRIPTLQEQVNSISDEQKELKSKVSTMQTDIIDIKGSINDIKEYLKNRNIKIDDNAKAGEPIASAEKVKNDSNKFINQKSNVILSDEELKLFHKKM